MPQTKRSGGSARKPRLASLLEHKLADYFTSEMELPGLVSITAVEPAANMQSATVWLSVYGTEPDQVLSMLQNHESRIQKYLLKNIKARYIPRLKFRIDISEEHADTIGRRLKELE